MEEPERKRRSRLGVAGWIALIVLAGFLVAAVAYAVHGWEALTGVGMSTFGWVVLTVGGIITIVLGAGLMWLVFYSSRHHYDR